ncbi:YqgU-like beta propeller domain-containing protein [Rummeliibacillus pycnus]|uniref:YqgU-like beta propeller domain-containing protein n=1 Tax=Rummeliibacillus pycnus TaxID=101070 RepID=UPI000C9A8BD4|nr:hypothetical protein [Rummeliibacillus pycnus]
MTTIKKIAYLLLFSTVFLVACQHQFNLKNDQKTPEKKSIETVKTISNVLPYRLKTAELHSVVGFLSEVDVLLIKQDQNGEHLIQYNLLNGKEKTIYSTKDDIIQAFIHPSMKQILVQTASSKKKAKVTILSVEGKTLHHIEVQSSELSIAWNPTNVNLLAIAAFSDNFSYKSFVYESNKSQLHEFQAENPFWVWVTDDTLWMNRMNNNPLNGGTLSSINWRKNKETKLSNHQVVYMNAYKQSTLIVSMDFKDGEFEYVLQKGTKKQIWKAPAVTSFSQWFVPDIQWLDDQSFITLLPTKGGEIDEGKTPFEIVHASINGVQQLGQMKNYEPMICSSKGSVCLTGFNYEKLFTTNNYKIKEWLSLRD